MTYEEAMQMILPGRYRHFNAKYHTRDLWYSSEPEVI